MKKMLMLLVAGGAIGLLTGCGVPQDEHDAKVLELNTAYTNAVTALEGTVADKEIIIKNEKQKNSKNLQTIDAKSSEITNLKKQLATTRKSLSEETAKANMLESQLKTSKAKASSAKNRAETAEDNLTALEAEHAELQTRFEMFEANMNAISNPEAAAAANAEEAMFDGEAAPETDAEKTARILQEMSDK